MEMRKLLNLFEGGNVFKDANNQAATQRINQTDVKPTIAWLEELTGLSLQDNTLGSTGRKPTSGDLDLAVDPAVISKQELQQRLLSWCQSQNLDPRDYVKSTGAGLHFRTPINGNADAGFVQTDFMFLPNVEFSKFVLTAPANSEYKGQDRNVLMNSIAKSMGYKLNQREGIADRATNEIISSDPDQIAKMLLNKGATRDDLYSVETIIAALENDPKKDEKLADAREHFKREGIPFFENKYDNSETSFMARLRDRIVNQGMYALIENECNPATLTESARIEHLEDLVFEKGSRGVADAVAIVQHAAQDTAKTTTVKWDGKPAIIWGRKPDGEFVLTDKSGFTAKGYDGLATSVDEIRAMMDLRKGDRTELVALYAKLFPLLKAATPPGFKGYVKGDLLFAEHPKEVAGAFVFRPNFIEYKIPVDSKLGQLIAPADVGVAIHTRMDGPDAAEEPIGNVKFKQVPGLLLIEPSVKDIQNVKAENKIIKQIKQILSKHAADIDTLFNPAELRAAQISDLPALCKKYINSRINSDFNDLLPGFPEWLSKNATPRKYKNIMEYIQSPRSNTDGITAAFALFMLLHDLKMDMLQQLDRQQPGQEGWVVATDSGRAKLVNRFGFSAGNRALNNPKP